MTLYNQRRSSSQILHGLLPQQTVDLDRRVWKVAFWESAPKLFIDTDTLRRELIRAVTPWSTRGTDSGFGRALFSGHQIEARRLDLESGVRVHQFPLVFRCRACSRVERSEEKPCSCGAHSWDQLHFVAYHGACGKVFEPRVPRCDVHDESRVHFPGSADASQVRFDCPVCQKELQRGLGVRRCDCGLSDDDPMRIPTVHRSASVYTPRGLTIVNPASPEKAAYLRAEGGGARALEWVLDGMVGEDPTVGPMSKEAMVMRLMKDMNLSREVAESMADTAEASGGLADPVPTLANPEQRQDAEDQAVTIVNATSSGRTTISTLIDGTDGHSHLGRLYRTEYPRAVHRAGFESVELMDRFPVLTGNFGYTRGSSEAGATRLRPFKDSRSDAYVVYSELAETEALFFRFDALRVHEWLTDRGHGLKPSSTDREAREALLDHCRIPDVNVEDSGNPAGHDLITLIHTMSHRVMRKVTVLAGLEPTSVSELIVPLHLGFFVYAAARGDFVLGGLQAVFETELETLLSRVVNDEHRCQLDPGCAAEGGACHACIHAGEPSCRLFNSQLDRSSLFGASGYLAGTG